METIRVECQILFPGENKKDEKRCHEFVVCCISPENGTSKGQW